METRQIVQGHIYYLLLNNIYDRCEERSLVAFSDDRNRLIDFYEQNLLPLEERYRDEGGMYRSFSKGPLYNFNCAMYEPLSECIKDNWLALDAIEEAKSRYLFV